MHLQGIGGGIWGIMGGWGKQIEKLFILIRLKSESTAK